MLGGLEAIDDTVRVAVTTYVEARLLAVFAGSKGAVSRQKVQEPIRVMREYKYKEKELLLPCLYAKAFAALTNRK